MSTKTYATKSYVRAGLPNKGVFTATASVHSIDGQHPYFSITGNLTEGKREVAGGCMHDDVRRYFSKLAPYIRWHLTSTDGPMHYIENARYHAGLCKGMDDARNMEHLKSTIVYGALASDYAVDLETLDDASLRSFLVGRFDALMAQFKADMVELFECAVFTA